MRLNRAPLRRGRRPHSLTPSVNGCSWHAGLPNRAKNEKPVRKDRQAGRESIFPLVSVCFAYNVREKGAAATLASLKQQDYPHLEIILAECGSEGSPPQIRRAAADGFKDHELRRIYRRSAEIGAGRNAAVREAKGEYLFFVDDHTSVVGAQCDLRFCTGRAASGRRHSDFGDQLFSRVVERIVGRVGSSTPAVRFSEVMPLPVLSSTASAAPTRWCGATHSNRRRIQRRSRVDP